MTSEPISLEPFLELEPGGHLHLDEFVDDPPPPYSLDWLPAIKRIVEGLSETDGAWAVFLDLGEIDQPPQSVDSIEDLAAAVNTERAYTPPSVYRLLDKFPHRAEGHSCEFRERVGTSVYRSISFFSSWKPWELDEAYGVSVAFYVGDFKEPITRTPFELVRRGLLKLGYSVHWWAWFDEFEPDSFPLTCRELFDDSGLADALEAGRTVFGRLIDEKLMALKALMLEVDADQDPEALLEDPKMARLQEASEAILDLIDEGTEAGTLSIETVEKALVQRGDAGRNSS